MACHFQQRLCSIATAHFLHPGVLQGFPLHLYSTGLPTAVFFFSFFSHRGVACVLETYAAIGGFLTLMDEERVWHGPCNIYCLACTGRGGTAWTSSSVLLDGGSFSTEMWTTLETKPAVASKYASEFSLLSKSYTTIVRAPQSVQRCSRRQTYRSSAKGAKDDQIWSAACDTWERWDMAPLSQHSSAILAGPSILSDPDRHGSPWRHYFFVRYC